MKQHIFIVAGDFSGQKHAAELVKAMKDADSECFVSSLGGKDLKAVSDAFIYDIESINAFGFTQPFKLYYKLKDIFENNIKKYWDTNKPDKVVLVDFYGFNIHVAKEAFKRSIPVYYYVSPQIWASRPGRIEQIKKYVTKMIVILPFEEELYKKKGVDAVFVGHPLIDRIPQTVKEPFYQKNSRPVIGLFPGSRTNTIKKHLNLLKETAAIIKESLDCEFLVFGMKNKQELYKDMGLNVVYEDINYENRKKLDFAITVSGTVSLENALLAIPMVVFYKLSWLNYLLAKVLVTVKNITMVNILNNTEVIPEFIQSKATPKHIAEKTLSIINDKEVYKKMSDALSGFRKMLGTPGVAKRAAGIILAGK